MKPLDVRNNKDSQALEDRAQQLARKVQVLRDEIGKALIGQDDLIFDLLTALLAGGNILLEGLPGLGKTLLVKSLASCLGLSFARIQFTPDLMPADITGTRIIEDIGGRLEFRFLKGPLFANLVLADEINRTTPKTQSALLEAMQEGSVTVADETHLLPQPFSVVATQNPIELEGTFPLPEAQLDRFLFHLLVPTPDRQQMVKILGATTSGREPRLQSVFSGEEILEFRQLSQQVLCGQHLLLYVAELLRATDPRQDDASTQTKRLVRYGASPRAGQSVILAAKVRALLDGRPAIAKEDLDRCTLPALRHRVVLSFEAEAEDCRVQDLLPEWQAAAATAIR